MASPNPSFIQTLSGMYPGRASMAPVLDLFMTLLAMGEHGYRDLLASRLRCAAIMRDGLSRLCETFHERMMMCRRNSISFAITLKCLDDRTSKSPAFLGAMLFQRHVSGCRVVEKTGKITTIASYSFNNWGAHCNSDLMSSSYLTAACAIGVKGEEINFFLRKLEKCLAKLIRGQDHRLTSAIISQERAQQEHPTENDEKPGERTDGLLRGEVK